jgi:hypothetical protein
MKFTVSKSMIVEADTYAEAATKGQRGLCDVDQFIEVTADGSDEIILFSPVISIGNSISGNH